METPILEGPIIFLIQSANTEGCTWITCGNAIPTCISN